MVDSVAALVPRQEIEGDMGDAHIALQARMMSHGLRKLLASLSHSKSCMIIFLNQVKIGAPVGLSLAENGGGVYCRCVRCVRLVLPLGCCFLVVFIFRATCYRPL